MARHDRPSPCRQSVAAVVADLGTDLHSGLTTAEATRRLATCGSNALRSTPRPPAWQRLLAQGNDPQVYLLLTAAAVTVLVARLQGNSGIPYEALIILAIVFLNALLGFLQEDRAERALAALSTMMPQRSTVLRDHLQQHILARHLVPGDILLLSEGDSVPADARLAQASALLTTESSLTGESLPIPKHTDPLSNAAALGDRANMVFAGTMVVSGNAKAIVTATGMHTEFGQIANLLEAEPAQLTPLQIQLRRLSKQLGAAVLLIAVIVVLVLLSVQGLQSPADVMSILIFGIALAVAATPEGLAAVITLALALGVQRMARRGAIVKKLPAVETLGSTTVIAADKTGTMTRNEMTVSTLVTASGITDLSGAGYAPEGQLTTPTHQPLSSVCAQETHQLLLAAALVNNAQLHHSATGWNIQGDPTEAALLTAARKAGIDTDQLPTLYPRLAEIPFSSERKRMSTIHPTSTQTPPPQQTTVFTKGAPDLLLDRCTHEFAAGIAAPLTPERRQQILLQNDQLTARALRTLGIATRTLSLTEADQSPTPDQTEQHLTFLGLIGMIDPPRPEARLAIERTRQAGIRTLLITGDHPHTAAAIARELGIPNATTVLSGAQLDLLSDLELRQAVQTTQVFARVNPQHKLRIVHALQQNHEIVAMTGDGVNDAPALKAAHIGVAMGITGTDVSRQAAALILTDDNFATIVAAVEEGRIVFDNIQKFLRYLLATNLGEVFTLFLSAVLLSFRTSTGPHHLTLPLTAAQILWINLITDGAPALALGVDPPAPHVMQRPPRRPQDAILGSQMLQDLLLVASVMTAGTLYIFFLAPPQHSIVHQRTMAFTTLMLFQLANALSARSESDSILVGLFRNRWLWAAILASIALQLTLLHVPILQRAFGVVSLTPHDWALCLGVASSIVWISELAKWIRRQHHPSAATHTVEASA